jgi:hypothetical protein
LFALISTAHCAGAFGMDADYNIARDIIEKIGVGKIVRCDKMPQPGDGADRELPYYPASLPN